MVDFPENAQVIRQYRINGKWVDEDRLEEELPLIFEAAQYFQNPAVFQHLGVALLQCETRLLVPKAKLNQ